MNIAERIAQEIVPRCLSRTCFREMGRDQCWGCDDQQARREEVAAIISRHLANRDSEPEWAKAMRVKNAEAIELLQKVLALGTSEQSVVPQQNAGEMLARLDGLGFGKQDGRRGNTLYAMVMDAADEIERSRLAAPQQAAWQPISSAPKDGTRILICSPDDVFVAEWDGNGWLYCATPQGQCGYVQSATGWQLAPLPPKDASGRET